MMPSFTSWPYTLIGVLLICIASTYGPTSPPETPLIDSYSKGIDYAESVQRATWGPWWWD